MSDTETVTAATADVNVDASKSVVFFPQTHIPHSHFTFSAGPQFLGEILPRVHELEFILCNLEYLDLTDQRVVKSNVSQGLLFTWETRGTLRMFEKKFEGELSCPACLHSTSTLHVMTCAIANIRRMCDIIDGKLNLISRMFVVKFQR